MSEKPENKGSSGGSSKKAKAKQHRRLAQLSHPMPLGFIYNTLTNHLESRRLTKDLIVFIPYLITFVFFFVGTRNVESEYYVAQGVRDLMAEELPPSNPLEAPATNTLPYFYKDYSEIGNEAEYYDWMEAVLPGQLFGDTNNRANALLGQVYPVGAIRIRSKHVRSDSCSSNKYMYPTPNLLEYPRPCYGPYDEHSELRDVPLSNGNVSFRWSNVECGEFWGELSWFEGQYGTYDCGGFIIDIPAGSSADEALAIVANLRNGKFANIESVRLLALEAIYYNKAVDVFLSMKMFIEVTEGGGFITQSRFRPFHVSDNEASWVWFSAWFCLFIVYFVIKFIVDLVRFYRINRKWVAFFFDVWNFLEIVNVLCLMATLTVYYWWWTMSGALDVKFPPRTVGNSTNAPVRIDDTKFNLELIGIAEMYQLTIYLSSLNTVISFLKILKYLRLNNRLNILSRTMEAVANSIIGVILIFTWVVTAYSIAGAMLYGTGLYEYRSSSASFAALFRLLVGDFDYEMMREENRGLTFVYFWSFVVIGLFILLNFVVAVVMNGFDEENARQRPVPIDVVISEWVGNVKRAVVSKGVLALVVEFLTVNVEDRLEEYIGTYMTTVRLTMQLDPENVETADSIHNTVDEKPFRRKDLESIMPKSEIEMLGEDNVDDLWCNIATEFEHTTIADGAAKIDKVKDSVFTSTVEGVTRVLIRHQRRLFGVTAEAKDKQARGEEDESQQASELNSASDSMNSSMRSFNISSLENTTRSSGKLDKMQSSVRRFDKHGSRLSFRGLSDGSSRLEGQQVMLSNGKPAMGTRDVVDDADKRIADLELRFGRMSELAAQLQQQVGTLQKSSAKK